MTLGILFTFLIFAFVLPLAWPDVSSRYSGIKKEVADYAVKNAWQAYSGLNYVTISGAFRISVEDIKQGDPNSQKCNGEFRSLTEPEAGDRFLATVSYHTLFGLARHNPDTFHICRILQPPKN